MSKARFTERIATLRASAVSIRTILEQEGETELYGFGDSDFWAHFSQIEEAGMSGDPTKAEWLADFTQIDDYGPMGRDLFLSWAALAALTRMPDSALDCGLAIWRQFPVNASHSRKIGLCYLLEASGSPEAIPIVEQMLQDPDRRVNREAERTLICLRFGKGYFWSED